MNSIVVSSISKKWPTLEKASRRIVRDFLLYFDKNKVSLEIYLVDNKTITRINVRFKNKNYPTNVLSFIYPKDWPAISSYRPLGEIYLAPDYIKTKKENFEYLLIHSLLHILGFDHKRKDDRIKMESYEKKICEVLEIPL